MPGERLRRLYGSIIPANASKSKHNLPVHNLTVYLYKLFTQNYGIAV